MSQEQYEIWMLDVTIHWDYSNKKKGHLDKKSDVIKTYKNEVSKGNTEEALRERVLSRLSSTHKFEKMKDHTMRVEIKKTRFCGYSITSY